MSGGPVFGDNGRVCGVICSSLVSPADEVDNHCSYAATVWPLMGLSVDVSPNPYGVIEQPYPFIDLAKQQIIHVDNWTRVSVCVASTPGLYNVTLQEHLEANLPVNTDPLASRSQCL